MFLLDFETASFQARTSAVVSGNCVFSNDGSPVPLKVSVQPAPRAMIEIAGFGGRKSAMYAVYFEAIHPFDIMPSGAGAAPPLISTSKGDLIPVAEANHSNTDPSAILPHTVYLCQLETSK